MRKIILNLAVSLDGFICDENGGFDWIKGHDDTSLDTAEKDDFEKFLEDVDTIVMGSIAYEDCVLAGLEAFDTKEILVPTHRVLESRQNVKFVDGDICEEVLALKMQEGKDIFIFGGAKLADQFVKQDLIDSYIIGIIPTLLGSGRKLFLGHPYEIKLHLEKLTVQDGIVIMTYNKRR